MEEQPGSSKHARAALAVRDRAVAMLRPGDELAIASDFDTFANIKTPTALLGIATRAGSCTVAIARSELDSAANLAAFLAGDDTLQMLRVAEFAGFDLAVERRKVHRPTTSG